MTLTVRIATLGTMLLSAAAQAAETPLYVGTYTRGKSRESQGIYLLHFNTDTGGLTFQGLAGESEDPSFLAMHPNGKFLYAVNETSSGELSAFVIEESGKLSMLNQVPSGGGAPCHLVIDRAGKTVLVANYSGGSVSSTEIRPDGSLGKQISFIQHRGSSVHETRQKAPHAHSINLDPENRFAVVADLGTDQLVVYRFDAATGTLARHGVTQLKSGAGPRHFAFHPNGSYAYAINELNSSLTALDYDAKSGELAARQVISTLPQGFKNSHTAEVRVSEDGRFVYGSNRGHDSLAVFRVGEQGRLSRIQIEPIGGRTPRNFNLSPLGKFLLVAGQASHDVRVFRVNAASGRLSMTDQRVQVPTPVCLRFAQGSD